MPPSTRARLKAESAVKPIQLSGVFDHGLFIQPIAARRNISFQVPPERLHQGEAFVAECVDLRHLLFGKGDQFGFLHIIENIQNVIRAARHKGGIMPHLPAIGVTQVLKSEKIRDFSRRQEGITAQVACQIGQTVKCEVVSWARSDTACSTL